jgi:hypothetical protein
MFPSQWDVQKWGQVLQEAKEKNISLLPPDVLAKFRIFLMACTRSSAQPSLGLNGLVQIIPIDTLIALDDVWVAWLEKVDSKCLAGQFRAIGTTLDTYLFEAACEALQRTFNPGALPPLLKIIHKAPPRTIYPSFRYLAAMGDEAAYEDLLSASRVEDRCDRGINDCLFVAGEEQAVSLYERLQCPGPGQYGSTARLLNKIRPDIMRGLTAALIRDSKMRAIWNPEYPRQEPSLKRAFEFGAAALTDEELLHEATLAPEEDPVGLKGLWIRLLSLRDSTCGTDELIQWVMIPKKNEYESNPIRQQAAQGILRRLLGPQREALVEKIKVMDATQRAILVDEILAGSGKFPGFAPRPLMMCGVGGNSEIMKTSPLELKSPNFILENQDRLFPWIEWTSHPEKLTTIYAQMTHLKARQHFIKRNLSIPLRQALFEFSVAI